MRTLDEILAGIEDGTLLRPSAFLEMDHASLLDERDQPSFESVWLQTHEEVLAKWKTLETAANLKPTVTAIRECAYKRCYAHTQHPELSGAVSDDFGLIAMACAAEFVLPSIEQWMAAYASGSIPH